VAVSGSSPMAEICSSAEEKDASGGQVAAPRAFTFYGLTSCLSYLLLPSRRAGVVKRVAVVSAVRRRVAARVVLPNADNSEYSFGPPTYKHCSSWVGYTYLRPCSRGSSPDGGVASSCWVSAGCV